MGIEVAGRRKSWRFQQVPVCSAWRLHCLLERGAHTGKTLGRKEKALRRKLSSYAVRAPHPSTSAVLRLKISYKYKRLTAQESAHTNSNTTVKCVLIRVEVCECMKTTVVVLANDTIFLSFIFIIRIAGHS